MGEHASYVRAANTEAARPPDTYFEDLRAAIAEYYLAEPDNPYRASGRGAGAERWDESRRCIAEAVDHDGHFLDVGCANGLLLESLTGWLRPEGVTIIPHGVDFVPELVALARARLPHVPPSNFEVANVWDWQSPRQYDYVRTNLDYVPPEYWPAWVARQYDHLVAPGGRLILCLYYPSRDPRPAPPLPADVLLALGLPVAGAASAPGTEVAWTDRP